MARVNAKNLIEKARKLANHFRITNDEKFSLKHIDPRETLGLKSEDKPRTKEELATGIQALAELQDKLYAQDKWSVLAISPA
jgi:hypothetical protein